MDPYKIVFHPYVTEKTMDLMDNNNSLEFIVKRTATKKQVKYAVERLFDAEVMKVNTRIAKDGKHAIVKFAPEVKAEDIGMRIGIF
ncbi:MAG: 50S ribosomal protein L23 [Candidatus Thermoplasmatota archaeon]